ncbi:C40 family peptidase [Alicyclobacillus fastidiosus]|uniref:C40 family peptidase n=1 Tax=Alicyclobacillus fastidiosus TaxID=392011 RepID=A0ABV5ACH9_9BACL|nr:C40 family peptidase [Alicyclobacillus fastidiosus]WEH10484.1 C40 family peptidase [Alicyclobacillus fastidiosus]
MKNRYKMIASGMLGGVIVIIAVIAFHFLGPSLKPAASSSKPTSTAPTNPSNVIIKLVPTKPVNTSHQTQLNATVQQVLSNPSDASFDASGFLQYVYAKVGVQLPRTIAEQSQVGTMVARSDLEDGDLVFFDLDGTSGTATFDGVYLGNNQFTAVTGHGLMTINLNDAYWSDKFLYGRRVL